MSPETGGAAALNKLIAANLRAERARARVTQNTVAAAMRDAGFGWHQQRCSAVEHGHSPLSAAEVITLAGVLSVPVGMLLRVTPTPEGITP